MKNTTLPLSRLLARHVCLWAALGALSALTFGPPPAQAAVTEAWVHRYSNVMSNSNDQAVKIVRDAAGDIIVTGNTDDRIHGSDMLTIKYSGADGSVLWQQRYNGPANLNDGATAVAVDGRGNVIVTGFSFLSASSADYYMAKYGAADGVLLWEKHYDVPANSSNPAQTVTVDGSGNVMVTGHSYNGTNTDYYTAKYAAADGALLWEKRYNSPANGDDYPTSVAVDGSGNVVVTGFSGNYPNSDYYTAKYAAANGALLWEKHYNSPANYDDQARAVAVDGSGNVVVTGVSATRNTQDGDPIYDYYTAKYAAADGALLWEQRYNGSANGGDYAQALAVDASGNVVVTGFSGNYPNEDYYTAKYAAANGALLWEKHYNGPADSNDIARALAVDGSGNVVVTGFSNNSASGFDYYTAKYATADGALLWEKRYNGPVNGNDYASAVVVDGSGNVVVTGFSYNGASGFDYYTAKYSAADGTLVWEKRYNGLADRPAGASAVAVDGRGNVVVTGSSDNATNTDYYTAKYAATDGALLWEKRYNGPANNDDFARAVAVDSSGNVVVTGSSDGSGSSPYDYYSEYYTAKYAAANGALLWEKHYNGPANRLDYASALALDGSGNVVVTGVSGAIVGCYECFFRGDYYTAKYAAADGALLWEKRYNGPANGVDYAYAVAVDRSGNVLVTGMTDGGNEDMGQYNNPDYYTAKYAAADGALLWEQRYNGPANAGDYARAVAVDGSGNVVVTGYSSNGDGYNPDYYTAKYAAADGELLWEKRYDGPENDDDRATAVAVDASGNVVVTGFSGKYPNYDYYTAKYAAADGALLWEKRYTNGSASAVAVDGSGNVVVTGYSYNASDSYSADYYYTAKYAAADGALLWEQRYNGGAASSLALGPNGMVAITGSSFGDYATVVYRDDAYPISIALIPAGVRLRFIGIPGRSYTIERAPTVTGPWTTLATPTAPASGLIEYDDTSPPAGSAFYRTAQP